MAQIVKENFNTYNDLENLFSFLNENGFKIHKTIYNGLIIEYRERYYKYSIEGVSTDVLPSFIEGNYVLCNENGDNID